MKKMILHCIKCMRVNYPIFFKKALQMNKNYGNVMHYQDLKFLNKYLRLNLDDQTLLKQVWQSWDVQVNRRLTIEELALGLQIPMDYEPPEVAEMEHVKAQRRRNAANVH